MAKKCPGLNPQNWKIDDIKEVPCRNCSYPIEFWKDDVILKCPQFKKEMVNPDLPNTCIAWCKKADQCLENPDVNKIKEDLHRGKSS